MNYDELWERIDNKHYITTVPYVPRLKNSKKNEAYRTSTRTLIQEFTDDCREAAKTELGVALTDDQFNVMFELAYEDGHGGGFSEILNCFMSLTDIAKTFVKLA